MQRNQKRRFSSAVLFILSCTTLGGSALAALGTDTNDDPVGRDVQIVAQAISAHALASITSTSHDKLLSALDILAPSISPNGGSYQESVMVSLDTTTSGADVRYTVDGTDVTLSSPLYAEPFVVTKNLTVKAKAFLPDTTFSSQSSSAFTIQINPIQVIYLHTDLLGSVTSETDVNGNVIKRTEYQPFGKSKDN